MIFAVTGHRSNRLQASKEEALRTSIRGILERYSNEQSRLLSGLAEGADQIAAEEALSLGISLEAILPFGYNEYAEQLGSRAKITMDKLIARAAQCITLEPSNALNPYVHLGRYLIQHSDILISIWDGKPGHGLGGTADVTQTAIKQSHPTIIISSSSPNSIQHMGLRS